MARVCEEIFLKGYGNNIKDGFWMDDLLKIQLDLLIQNIKNDWDFTIIISGGGEVRVGKSVLALQIGAYWNYMIGKLYGINNEFGLKNIVFDGTRLISTGHEMGKGHPYSVMIYDEAGADLAGTKVLTQMTQNVMDYYRECGQYNFLNILVIPEFFDLPKGIALSRSIFLLDVYYRPNEKGIFERGYFSFFSRPNKKLLYLKGKKELNYTAYPADFNKGRFLNFYPINESEYRKAKEKAFIGRIDRKNLRFITQRNACWYLLMNEFKLTYEELSERMERLTGWDAHHDTIDDAIKPFIEKFEKK